jgi:outer membrane murein-binding lipoprotein Lpp
VKPTVELALGLVGGGAALAAVLNAIAKGMQWALTRLIREELNPAVGKLTAEFAAMRASFEAAQENSSRGNEEMHEAVLALRDTVERMDGRVAGVETTVRVLEERVEHLRKEAPRA